MSEPFNAFNNNTYKELRSKFENVTKKINNYKSRTLPDDQNERKIRIDTYRSELFETYNNIVSYVDGFYFNK